MEVTYVNRLCKNYLLNLWMEYTFHIVETSWKTTLLGRKWWDWDNGINFR